MNTVPTEKTSSLAYSFEQALLDMDRVTANRLADGVDDKSTFIEEILIPIMEKIGAAWERGDVVLAQVYISCQISEEILAAIFAADTTCRLRHIKDTQKNIGIVLLEDFHSLGKSIVTSTLNAGGFDVRDLGRLTVEETVQEVMVENIDILLVSALMLPSALRVKNLRELLLKNGVAVKIVVGGVPFRLDDGLWQEVGADEMGRTSTDALHIVERLVREVG